MIIQKSGKTIVLKRHELILTVSLQHWSELQQYNFFLRERAV